jgi:hypothetical protein
MATLGPAGIGPRPPARGPRGIRPLVREESDDRGDRPRHPSRRATGLRPPVGSRGCAANRPCVANGS